MKYATIRYHPYKFYDNYENSYVVGRNKKIFSCLRPGNIQNNSHPGGAPETTIYFFWPYLPETQVIHWVTTNGKRVTGDGGSAGRRSDKGNGP